MCGHVGAIINRLSWKHFLGRCGRKSSPQNDLIIVCFNLSHIVKRGRKPSFPGRLKASEKTEKYSKRFTFYDNGASSYVRWCLVGISGNGSFIKSQFGEPIWGAWLKWKFGWKDLQSDEAAWMSVNLLKRYWQLWIVTCQRSLAYQLKRPNLVRSLRIAC